ncbi:MAG: hypothetical protein MJ211_04620 [Bacteroidales bacterium]|nr:hypothetical protein [Bacteroidales bacterium]
MAKIAQYSYINEKVHKIGTKDETIIISEEELAENNILTLTYRKLDLNYPKFFKMDNLSKIGFLNSEMILKNYPALSDEEKKNTSVICFNRLASLTTDKNFENTIFDQNNFFPSPSLFVYTLPNIVTGEICIRNKFYGESSFYVNEKFDSKQMEGIILDALQTSDNILLGWSDCINSQIVALMFLITKKGTVKMQNFNAQNLEYIYKKFF